MFDNPHHVCQCFRGERWGGVVGANRRMLAPVNYWGPCYQRGRHIALRKCRVGPGPRLSTRWTLASGTCAVGCQRKLDRLTWLHKTPISGRFPHLLLLTHRCQRVELIKFEFEWMERVWKTGVTTISLSVKLLQDIVLASKWLCRLTPYSTSLWHSGDKAGLTDW